MIFSIIVNTIERVKSCLFGNSNQNKAIIMNEYNKRGAAFMSMAIMIFCLFVLGYFVYLAIAD